MEIDRDKLRAAVRKLGDEYVFYVLDDAIDLLPQSELVQRYTDPSALKPDAAPVDTLQEAVVAFEEASLAGDYYEDFNVNSRNFMEKSTGTRSWIADCTRLLSRCVAEAEEMTAGDVRKVIETIVGLLDKIDECNGDIIFFADEAGSWQVGVDWDRLLPVWFKALSETASPTEYSQRVTTVLRNHYDYKREEMIAMARKAATPEQRHALAEPS